MLHGNVIATDKIIEITDENRPYRQPRIRTMGLTTATELERSQIAGFTMGYLNNDDTKDRKMLRPLLRGLDDPWPGDPWGRVARLEFIFHHDDKAKLYRRGVGVFDSFGTPLFFARYAGLGDNGDRSMFSRFLLLELGVPDSLCQQINAAVRGQYDTLVVSREAHRKLNNVDTPLLDYRLRDTWEWWIA